MGTIILRGLNTGPQQISNTAATYIDDAPFSASGFLSAGTFITPDPDIADLDRVEVLKGPQGTLYGANSLGGLVRIVSRRPQLDEFSGLRSEEHTSELQSLMRISYAVFCLTKNNNTYSTSQ